MDNTVLRVTCFLCLHIHVFCNFTMIMNRLLILASFLEHGGYALIHFQCSIC